MYRNKDNEWSAGWKRMEMDGDIKDSYLVWNDSPTYSKRFSIFLLRRYPHGRFISISFIKDAILGFEVDLSCSDKAGTFCASLMPGSDPRSVHLMWIMVCDGKRMRTRTQKTTILNDF